MFALRRDELIEPLRARLLVAIDRFRDLVAGAPREASVPTPEPPASAGPEVDRFTREVATAPTWQARVVAANALAELRGDRVVDALVRAVRDPSAEVAVAAVEALACQPGPRAAEDLREVLRETEGAVGPFTRAAAVEAIARCQGHAALPLLREALHDGDVEVSMAAVHALARVAPDESAPWLHTLLEDRSGYFSPVVRLATAKALQHSGRLDASRARSLLETETNEGVRFVLERAASRFA